MSSEKESRQKKPRLQNKQDDKEQSELFLEKAREVEADEKESASDRLMGDLARLKPDPRTNSPKK